MHTLQITLRPAGLYATASSEPLRPPEPAGSGGREQLRAIGFTI